MGSNLRESEFIHYRLSNDYIRGLTDGEGCFTFSTNTYYRSGEKVKEKSPAFVIAMHVRDKWLIIETAEHLGIKDNVYINKPYIKDGSKRGYIVRFMVRSLGQIRDIIIPFFYKKLAGYKGDQFTQWLEDIGNDPLVAKRYRVLYQMYKAGYWDDPKNIPERLV